jgi:putative two-component system response regulator
MLFKSAPLHDIGKVGIPDRILLKPGRLTPDEFEIMKTHTTLGWAMPSAHAERRWAPNVEFLRLAKEIAYTTRRNGTAAATPRAWPASAIPLSARLMAVADVYDALISRRVYKDADAQAVEVIAGAAAAISTRMSSTPSWPSRTNSRPRPSASRIRTRTCCARRNNLRASDGLPVIAWRGR